MKMRKWFITWTFCSNFLRFSCFNVWNIRLIFQCFHTAWRRDKCKKNKKKFISKNRKISKNEQNPRQNHDIILRDEICVCVCVHILCHQFTWNCSNHDKNIYHYSILNQRLSISFLGFSSFYGVKTVVSIQYTKKLNQLNLKIGKCTLRYTVTGNKKHQKITIEVWNELLYSVHHSIRER